MAHALCYLPASDATLHYCIVSHCGSGVTYANEGQSVQWWHECFSARKPIDVWKEFQLKCIQDRNMRNNALLSEATCLINPLSPTQIPIGAWVQTQTSYIHSQAHKYINTL